MFIKVDMFFPTSRAGLWRFPLKAEPDSRPPVDTLADNPEIREPAMKGHLNALNWNLPFVIPIRLGWIMSLGISKVKFLIF